LVLFANDVSPDSARLLSERMSESEQAEILAVLGHAVAELPISAEQANAAANALAGAMHPGLDTPKFVMLAVSLAAFQEKAYNRPFDVAGTTLVNRLIATREPYALAILASALREISKKLTRVTSASLASRLAPRVLSETDPAALVRLALAFDAVGASWSEAQKTQFAAQIEDREQKAAGPATKRTFQFLLYSVGSRPKAVHLDDLEEDSSGCLPITLPLAVNQLLNPLCKEESWQGTAVTVARLTGEPVAHVTAAPGTFTAEELLGVQDDDGETRGPNDDAIEVDFNKLSEVISKFREPRHISVGAAETPGLAVAIVGSILVLSSLRRLKHWDKLGS
jgi:hypothetical protein